MCTQQTSLLVWLKGMGGSSLISGRRVISGQKDSEMPDLLGTQVDAPLLRTG